MPPVLPGKVISASIAKKFDVFQGLTREQIIELNSWMVRKELRPNEYVFKEGDKADGLYVLCQGSVMIIKESARGKFKLAELDAPNFFGEMAILRDTPRMATVRAIRQTTLFAMERDAFRGLVAQSMGTTRDFDQVIQQRLEEIRGSKPS